MGVLEERIGGWLCAFRAEADLTEVQKMQAHMPSIEFVYTSFE
jgi:hypothetical protein